MSQMNDVILELKKEYLESFEEKIQTIETLWQKKERELLLNEFHKIKGTGATYGVPEVTELGRVMEELCAQGPDNLGVLVLLSTELLRRIQYHHTLPDSLWNLEKDPDFARLLDSLEETPEELAG